MTEYVKVGGLKVAAVLYDLVRTELSPGTGIEPEAVWATLESIVTTLGPRNDALLEKRDALQAQIIEWLSTHAAGGIDETAYRRFLEQIGYIVPEGPDFSVDTSGVDPEISTVAGPQLVVPVDKARYALNAANARWGSLYDALYGTDVIAGSGDANPSAGYDPARGEQVIAWTNAFLDETVPLCNGAGSGGDPKAVTASLESLADRLRADHGEPEKWSSLAGPRRSDPCGQTRGGR